MNVGWVRISRVLFRGGRGKQNNLHKNDSWQQQHYHAMIKPTGYLSKLLKMALFSCPGPNSRLDLETILKIALFTVAMP